MSQPATPYVLLQVAFSGQKGVLRLLGGMLHPIYRPGAGITTPFPAQSGGCHHESSFLALSTVVGPRNFSTKKSRKRTYIVSGHSFRPLRLTPARTENAPLARLTHLDTPKLLPRSNPCPSSTIPSVPASHRPKNLNFLDLRKF